MQQSKAGCHSVLISFIFLVVFFIGMQSYALDAQQVYAQVKDSIFTLYSVDMQTKRAKTRGSAVAIAKNILATNCHVALAGDYLIVRIGTKFKTAKIFYRDEAEDLCLLQVPNVSFVPVKIRKSETVQIGEVVYAVGNPEGTEKSLSQGIISNKHKVRGGVWLQTDASIYYGSSGGGLFDNKGELIGITAKMGGNFGFALPTEWILTALAGEHSSTTVAESDAIKTDREPRFMQKDRADYSKASAHLVLLGTFGSNQIQLYRNNQECFLSIPGRLSQGQLRGLSIWNPKFNDRLIIFASAASVKDALELLLRSIRERQMHRHVSYKTANTLYLAGSNYPLYGIKSDTENYAYFVARFNKDMLQQLSELSQFSVQFNDQDSRIGHARVVYTMDGIKLAISAYYQECAKRSPTAK